MVGTAGPAQLQGRLPAGMETKGYPTSASVCTRRVFKCWLTPQENVMWTKSNGTVENHPSLILWPQGVSGGEGGASARPSHFPSHALSSPTAPSF